MIVERVIFCQGTDAEEPLRILEDHGPEAAVAYLEQWHYPGEHEQATELAGGTRDDTHRSEDYVLTWNVGLGYIGLEYIEQPWTATARPTSRKPTTGLCGGARCATSGRISYAVAVFGCGAVCGSEPVTRLPAEGDAMTDNDLRDLIAAQAELRSVLRDLREVRSAQHTVAFFRPVDAAFFRTDDAASRALALIRGVIDRTPGYVKAID